MIPWSRLSLFHTIIFYVYFNNVYFKLVIISQSNNIYLFLTDIHVYILILRNMSKFILYLAFKHRIRNFAQISIFLNFT